MGKIWLILLLSFSGAWFDYPVGRYKESGLLVDTGSGFFPFDSATLTRMGYHKPDTLKKYGPEGQKDFKRSCGDALNEFLAFEEERAGFQFSTRIHGIPPDARVMEAVLLGTRGIEDRMMVLWVHSPWVYLKCESKYQCSEYTTGSHYLGRTRLSLVNTRTNTVINTIPVKFPDEKKFPMHAGASGTRTDYFYIPFYIGNPLQNSENHLFRYETTSLVNKEKEAKHGRAIIMNLKDYNADGKDLEFIAYNQVACNSCMTALYGYSVKRDRVIQYPFILNKVEKTGEDSVQSIFVSRWADNLFINDPIEPRHWRYSNNYLMEGNYVEYYDVFYNDSLETFEGRLELKKR